MKIARFFIKSFFVIALSLSFAVFGAIAYLEANVSKEYKIKKGDTLTIDTKIPVTAVFEGAELSAKNTLSAVGREYSVNLKAFGLIPFSTVNVEVVDEMQVVVLGSPFGMKLYTKGVLVVDMTDVNTSGGTYNPARQAGIKKGVYIISVNGTKIYTNEDLGNIVEKSGGAKMNFLVMREGKKIHINFCAARDSETGNYKIGVWIKDSSAGIGTLTFYSPATNIVCGLGHGICDEDTGTLLEVKSGELVDGQIISVQKGEVGSPGKLNGKLGYKTIGDINLNTEQGVYANLNGEVDMSNLVEIALKHEIKDSDAKILCTVDGEEPKYYDCKIKLRSSAFHSKIQNMVVTVTDKELLNKTGGIIQGLSGSPLLQNGKLIGAVTHVLIDDPTKGYAIFAENMLETAQSVAEGQQLKEAS